MVVVVVVVVSRSSSSGSCNTMESFFSERKVRYPVTLKQTCLAQLLYSSNSYIGSVGRPGAGEGY